MIDVKIYRVNREQETIKQVLAGVCETIGDAYDINAGNKGDYFVVIDDKYIIDWNGAMVAVKHRIGRYEPFYLITNYIQEEDRLISNLTAWHNTSESAYLLGGLGDDIHTEIYEIDLEHLKVRNVINTPMTESEAMEWKRV